MDNDGQFANWVGTAMTSLGVAVGLAAALLKNIPASVRAGLWIVAALFAVVGLWSLSKAAGIARRAKRAQRTGVSAFGDEKFTSAGLAWETIDDDDKGRCLVRIRQSGGELPQPLVIKAQANFELSEGFGYFYPHQNNLSVRTAGEIQAVIRGKEARFELREPKLHTPALFSILLVGKSDDRLAVKRIERRE